MIRRVGLALLTGALLAVIVAPALGEDLPTIEKKVIESWQKHRSMTAKINLTTHMEMPGMAMDGKGSGIVEVMKKENKIYLRMELKNEMTQKMGEEESKMEQEMTTIIDGEYAHTLTDMMGQKMAVKTAIDPKMTGDPTLLFEDLKKNYELKVLPDETVESVKTYVIEATPKDKAENAGMSKMTLYFSQDNGVQIKMVMFDANGQPMTTFTYSDIKLDVDINPDRFVFKAPPGVQVMDQTGTNNP
ncbi:MAG: outer membrane lipoprotein-sorting protein [Phycisphaerae bacterium]